MGGRKKHIHNDEDKHIQTHQYVLVRGLLYYISQLACLSFQITSALGEIVA